jgi:hypothetical protein
VARHIDLILELFKNFCKQTFKLSNFACLPCFRLVYTVFTLNLWILTSCQWASFGVLFVSMCQKWPPKSSLGHDLEGIEWQCYQLTNSSFFCKNQLKKQEVPKTKSGRAVLAVFWLLWFLTELLTTELLTTQLLYEKNHVTSFDFDGTFDDANFVTRKFTQPRFLLCPHLCCNFTLRIFVF